MQNLIFKLKRKKLKIPSNTDGIFGVELRGIEPLYPSDNSGLLTRGSPLNSTKLSYQKAYKKERPSKARAFGDSIESAVVPLSLAYPLLMSIMRVHNPKAHLK